MRNRTESERRMVKDLPDTGFTVDNGVFICPDRGQQIVYSLLKLQGQTSCSLVVRTSRFLHD